jgi:hypothetical protein
MERGEDGREHAFDVLDDLVVPEAQYAPSALFEPLGSLRVADAIGVLPAIGFENQRMVEADEIDDEWPDPMLASEFEPCQLSAAQCSPKPALDIGRMCAESLCEPILHGANSTMSGAAG